MNELPELQVMSVKIPVSDLAASRRWYADVFGLTEVMEWPDADGVVRGVALSGLGTVLLALREHPAAAAATHGFGFVNVQVPGEEDLSGCGDAPGPVADPSHPGDQRGQGSPGRLPRP